MITIPDKIATSEEWLPVVGFEGYYEVSDLGRVRSMSRVQRHGHRLKGRLLKQSNAGRYPAVTLRKNNTAKTCCLHVMALEAFVGPRPENMEGCHNDGDPTNNSRANLRWDTHKNNSEDSRKHGTMMMGTKQPTAKLDEIDIEHIRDLCANGVTHRTIASYFKISVAHVSFIRNNLRWSHIC